MEKQTVQLSAGELAEYCFPEGSLGTMPSVDRMMQGTSAHKKLQNIYSEKETIQYQREVPLETILDCGEFFLKIQGRADGIFFDKTDYFIHEIKSTYCEAASIQEPLKAAHKAQMMIYAYIYAKDHALAHIQGRLSYFCLLDEGIVDFEYRFSLKSLEIFIRELAEDYSKIISRRLQAQHDFFVSVQTLAFPFPNFRKGQHEGAAQIYSAIRQGKNLFLQAPTGSGKTMMALFPAIKNMAQGDVEKIFCFSAKNQTMEVNAQALRLLRNQGLKIKSCVITAKSKACRMSEQDCTPENCPYSQDFFKKLHDALPEILKQDDFSPEVIAQAAEKYQICPYELSLELSLEAQVILADYNYLFDPMVYLRRYFEQENGPYAFLIDEAHNLIERGRDMYSSSLSKKRISEVKKLLPKENKLYRQIGKLYTELNKLFKAYEAEAPIALDDVKKINFRILSINETMAELLQKHPLPAEVTLFVKDAFRFQMLFEFFKENHFALYHQGGRELVLQCLDPSPYLEESIAKGSSAILYSATLTPYKFYKNSLLPQKDAYGFSAPYPFDAGKLLVLADYSVDTRYAVRDQFYSVIAKKIKKCRENAAGTIIVYFPSFQFMHAVAEEMDIPLLLQEAEATAEERMLFMEKLKEKNTLAFAVMGSHFSEGVDFRGLSGIIIVGVALPQYNQQRERIRAHFQNLYQKGFEYAYVYPGMNKVCQASGRLIRTAEDTGFLLLMDQRFKSYGHLLPAYWQITPCTKEDDIYKKIQEVTGTFHQ